MIGQKEFGRAGKYNTLVCKLSLLIVEVLLTYHSSQVYNFRYVWQMELKFHTQLDGSYIYHVWKYYTAEHCCVLLFLKYRSLLHRTFFWDTRY